MTDPSAVHRPHNYFSEAVGALRRRPLRDRRLAAAGLSLIGLALLIAIGAALWPKTEAARPAPAIAAAAPPEIGDALVLLRPSDGRNGAPLALAKGRPLFPVPVGGSLASFAGGPVEMQGVRVYGLAGETGFWVGESPDQRVFVQVPPSAIEKGALRPNSLAVDSLISVSGRMTPVPDSPADLRLNAPDMNHLYLQEHMIAANSVRPYR